MLAGTIPWPDMGAPFFGCSKPSQSTGWVVAMDSFGTTASPDRNEDS